VTIELSRKVCGKLWEKSDDTRMWRRSSSCADGACVEVANDGERIYMRDSKDLDLPALSFDRANWKRFVDDVRDGRFEVR
jgi:Domain of unknown function (DUF397)